MAKNPPEAEVIHQPEGFHYKEHYREYSEQTKSVSGFAWTMSFLSLLFCLIPVFGFIFALFALFVAAIKKTSVIIPIVSLVVSSLVTMFVLSIAWLFSLIF